MESIGSLLLLDLDAAELEQYAGEYALLGTTIRVCVQGDMLFLSIPGEPEYTLQPTKENLFLIKEFEASSVKFSTPVDGRMS